ncbi:MAG: helix-turn-helix domain-containing protein [Tissierellales bacterium]|nr:helix-turn-helix domain-containing protein [Tissierellales bacterium]
MNYYYEPINKDEKIPIKIFTQELEQFPFHWHDEAEIIFILKGKCCINIDNDITELSQGDIFIINSREIHLLKSYGDDKCRLLVFQFDLNYFEDKHRGINNLTFKIKESEANKAFIEKIKSILASIMDQTLKREEYYELRIELLFTELMLILIDNFSQKIDKNSFDMKKDSERIMKIIEYIKDNIDNPNLNTQSIADNFYLNSQYLSKYFKKNTGIPIKKFIENLRVSRSINDLKYTELKIVDLALKNGFPDAKSYYRSFKEITGTTPNEFRNENKVEIDNFDYKNYFSINTEELLSELFLYLDYSKPIFLSSNIKTKEIKISLNVDDKKTQIQDFKKPWENLITIGYSLEGLRKDIFDNIAKAQKEIGFKFLRFHGVFSDLLGIYGENIKGESYINFQEIDILFDLLMENKIKPFIELTFIPKKISMEQNGIFLWNDSVKNPYDISKWNNLIDKFIRHLIDRYGINEVKGWYFEVWNEPEIEGVFWDGSREEFFRFFENTFRTIKNISKDLKVDGVGNISFLLFTDWVDDFYNYLKSRDIILDFYSFHVYSIDLVEEIQDFKSLKKEIEINGSDSARYKAKLGDSNNINDYIDYTLNRVNALKGFTKNEYWITEFNSSTLPNDLLHDTVFMSSFLVKNYIDNFHKVDGIGYWTLTDLNNELSIKKALFHGGFGLITYNGIPKASYNAYILMHELKGEVIDKNENYIVLKDAENIYLLFHNYIHYDQMYENLDFSKINELERYNIFEDINLAVEIELKGINGRYKVEQYIVNRKNGSSFDAWVEMGYPEYPDDFQVQYLKSRSIPKITFEEIEIKNSYRNNLILDPHEIRLIKLTKLYR